MSPRPSLRIAPVVAAAVLVFSGCGNGDGAGDSTTTTQEASDTTVADTASPTSFNVPQVTAETRPPETSTTTTAASIAPSTSIEPTSVEEEIAAAAVEAREAYLYAVYNVDAPDALVRLEATHAPGGASLEIGLKNYRSIVDNGWKARPNPDVPDTITVESPVDSPRRHDCRTDVVRCRRRSRLRTGRS